MALRQKQLNALRADILKGLTTAKQLPQFRAEVIDLQARLDNLKARERAGAIRPFYGSYIQTIRSSQSK